MPEMYIKQLWFTYSACRLCTKNKGRMQQLKKAGDSSQDIFIKSN